MSKNQSKKPEQAGLHEKRLADLLKFLSTNETTIKSEGITYTSKRGDGYNHIKDVIQQITGMSEKAYYAYFEDMELGNKFSEMRKVYDTVGKVIHSIRPYLTFDGSIDSQKNSLLKSGYPLYNAFKDEETLPYLDEFYDPFYNSVLYYLDEYEKDPVKSLSSIKEHDSPLFFYINQLLDDFRDDSNSQELKFYKSISAKFKQDYKACLEADSKTQFISGYRSLSIPTNPVTAKEFFYSRIKSEQHSAPDLLYNPLEYVNVLNHRYEYIWALHLHKIDFKMWPDIAKAILPIVVFEQTILTTYIEVFIYHCIDNTRFQVTSASDEIRPRHVHTDLTYIQLCELLVEYQFFDVEHDFLPNGLNLLRRPLNIHPVYDVAKLGESESIIQAAILKQMWTIYYRKITQDLDIIQHPEYNHPLPRVRTKNLINLIPD